MTEWVEERKRGLSSGLDMCASSKGRGNKLRWESGGNCEQGQTQGAWGLCWGACLLCCGAPVKDGKVSLFVNSKSSYNTV